METLFWPRAYNQTCNVVSPIDSNSSSSPIDIVGHGSSYMQMVGIPPAYEFLHFEDISQDGNNIPNMESSPQNFSPQYQNLPYTQLTIDNSNAQNDSNVIAMVYDVQQSCASAIGPEICNNDIQPNYDNVDKYFNTGIPMVYDVQQSCAPATVPLVCDNNIQPNYDNVDRYFNTGELYADVNVNNDVSQIQNECPQVENIALPVCDNNNIDNQDTGFLFGAIEGFESILAETEEEQNADKNNIFPSDAILDEILRDNEETNVDRIVGNQLNSSIEIGTRSDVDVTKDILASSFDIYDQEVGQPANHVIDVEVFKNVIGENIHVNPPQVNPPVIAPPEVYSSEVYSPKVTPSLVYPPEFTPPIEIFEDSKSTKCVFEKDDKQVILPVKQKAFESHNIKCAKPGPSETSKKPKAPVKKLDHKIMDYVLINDEEIDVETITKDEEPILQAKDVMTLYEEFEKCSGMKFGTPEELEKETTPETTQKISIQHSTKRVEIPLNSTNKEGEKSEKLNAKKKESLKKYKTRSSVASTKKKKNDKSLVNKIKESLMRINGSKPMNDNQKVKDIKYPPKSDKSNLSKSETSSKPNTPLLQNLPKNKKCEESRSHLQRKEDTNQRKIDTTKSVQQHNKNKNHDRHSPNSKPLNGIARSSPPKDCKTDVPKELIGRIKDSNKPRTIVLLDDPLFLGGDPIINRKKSSKKNPDRKSPSRITNSIAAKTAAVPTVGNKSNSIATKTSGVSTITNKSNLFATKMSVVPIVSNKSNMMAANVSAADFSRFQICDKRLENKKMVIHSNTIVKPKPIVIPSSSNLLPKSNNSPTSVMFPKNSGSNGHQLKSASTMPTISMPKIKIEANPKWNNLIYRINLDHSYSMRSENDNKNAMSSNKDMQNYQIPQNGHIAKNLNKDTTGVQTGEENVSNRAPKKISLEEYQKTKRNLKPKTDTSKLPKDESSKKLNLCKAQETTDKQSQDQSVSVGAHKVLQKDNSTSVGNSPKNTTPNEPQFRQDQTMNIMPETPKRLPSPIRRAHVYVDACIVNEDGLNKLDEMNAVLQKSNSKLTESSLINSFKDTIPNKPQSELDKEKVFEDGRYYNFVPIVRKPVMVDVGMQTNISLIKMKPLKRHRSESDSSNDEDSSSSYESRTSRHSRVSPDPRSSRSPRMYQSAACSSSPLHMYNSEIQSPTSFRTRKEEEEFKDDALNRRIVFLGDIPSDVDENELWRTFKIYGPIKRIKIYHRRSKKFKTASGCRSQDYAFITFYASKSAFDALNNYKEDFPNGVNYLMCFGGRREFCKDQYADYDTMPKTYQPEVYTREEKTFDDLFEDYKKKRGYNQEAVKDSHNTKKLQNQGPQ